MPTGWIERDGTASMRDLAQKVCQLVSTFGPLIERQWGDNPEMMTALAWARGACTIVPKFDAAFESIPSGDPVNDDGALWPGVSPDKPPAGTPNEPA